MHQFEIQYTEYNEKGAITSIKHYLHPANIAECKQKFDELSRQTRTVVDDEDVEHTYKAYKVEVRLATYKVVDDVAALWAMFGV